MLISLVSSAFNEEHNLPVLYHRLARVLDSEGVEWEWIIVDDRSTDATFGAISRLSSADPRVRGVRFSRNFGSHAAKMCALRYLRGACMICFAADLQDSPEDIPRMLARWRDGARVVWAVRGRRLGESWSTIWFSSLYHWIIRHLAGLKDFPNCGSFCLLDRRVVDALQQCRERSVSFFALVHWLGFPAQVVTVDQQPRLHGQSGWTLRKKLRLVRDSVVGFSFLPGRVVAAAGLTVGLLALAAAVWLALRYWLYSFTEQWAWALALIAGLGGLQLLAIGIVGEYVWASLQQSRQRPPYLVEDTIGFDDPGMELSGPGPIRVFDAEHDPFA